MLPKLQGMLSSKNLNARLALTAVVGGLALTAVLMSFKMNIFEASLYDFRIRNSGPRFGMSQKESPVVLIGIDDATTEALDDFAPLHVKHHLELLQKLKHSGAKSIAFMVNFNESLGENIVGTSPDERRDAGLAAEDFRKLATSVSEHGTPVFLSTDIAVSGEQIKPPYPLSTLAHAPAIIHKDGTVFSEDKVTRRAILKINGERTLHALLAEQITPRPENYRYRGTYKVLEVNAKYFLINYRGPTQEGRTRYTEYSFKDVVDGKVPLSAFKDKVVVIGTHSQSNSNDYTYTPFSREIFTNPKLHVHASIIETLANNDALKPSGRMIDSLMTFGLTSLIIWMVFSTSPAMGVTITIALGLMYIILSVLLFRLASISLGMAQPLLGIFFAYYVFVPYRLIMEYKTRGAFQRKHEVLMQVDELKRNFMSLITHDLKTPVARIQGMAEMLGRGGADAKIVDSIVQSTDELNRFITSILELAKVETNNIQLHKVSKDVNRVVEECVRKFEFQAKNRNIDIITDLEPLFPILFDVSLVTKILSNLIDNAIKYSPMGSTITLSSCESSKRRGFIEINVSDDGAGIAPIDLENLFSKFYRPQNDTSMQTKGYGLGLYLSRFFAEMHNGALEVKSQIGKGSTFTLYLPMDEQLELPATKDSVTENQHTTTGGAYV